MKIFATSAMFLLLLSSKGLALDLSDMGSPTSRTPYDRYFKGVRQTLAKASGKAQMAEAKELMKQGRGFRYAFTSAYVPQPAIVTERTRRGDCKAKSLWVADRMNDTSLRFVVGKLREGTIGNHMWLMWNDGGKWWILDPTVEWSPIEAASVGAREWVALYSYTREGGLIHTASARYAMARKSLETIGKP